MQIQLNKFQTRTLSKFFKKIDFDHISFEESIEGGVLIRATDTGGWEAAIDIDRFGKTTSFLKTNTKEYPLEGLDENINENQQIQS